MAGGIIQERSEANHGQRTQSTFRAKPAYRRRPESSRAHLPALAIKYLRINFSPEQFPFYSLHLLLDLTATLLIEARQIIIVVNLDAFFCGQLLQAGLPVVAVILADNGSHRGIRFQCGEVDGDGRAFELFLFSGDLQHQLEHLFIH